MRCSEIFVLKGMGVPEVKGLRVFFMCCINLHIVVILWFWRFPRQKHNIEFKTIQNITKVFNLALIPDVKLMRTMK